MANIRLTVVIRRDLLLEPGLLAAQVSHIADMFMRRKIQIAASRTHLGFTNVEMQWISEPYISILGVNCYEDLNEIIKHCKRQKLTHHVWVDTIPSPTGKTTNRPSFIKALVGISIGPEDFDKIKIVTGHLLPY
jgi:peptidyl-tRNA hydrolase